jgi:DNA-binding NarL/FixJ family response regulator
MGRKATPPTRILIVDDHPIVRFGIGQMIASEPTLVVAAEAESAEAARELVRATAFDLAIVDLSLGAGSGLELVRELSQAAPPLPVLVLSMHDEALFAERALRAGARGYIMKREAITGLVGAIREVLAGRIYLSGRMSQSFLEAVGRPAPVPGDRIGGLSDRELEVLEMIGRGLSTTAIAGQLHLSIKTVETHRANIKTKLALKDGLDLVRYAVTWVERR